MKDILIKASEIEFYVPSGDCVIMTLCLTRYMQEKHNTELQVHVGALVDGVGNTTLHMWNSYKGKIIDLTAHTQVYEKGQSMILDEPISEKGHAKRIPSHKLKSKNLTDFAKNQVKKAKKVDPNVITVSHFFLKYKKDSQIPYAEAIESMNTDSRNSYYETFLLLMGQE